MRTRLLPILAILVAAACEPEPADFPQQEAIFGAARPDELILLTAAGDLVSVAVDDERIAGADVNVAWVTSGAGRALRGVAWSLPVSVDVTDGVAAGLVGATPLRLTTGRDGGVLRARGLVRGAMSDFTVEDQRIAGTIGRCSYELRRASRLYEGARSCGGQPQPVRMLLPRALSRWSDASVAATLGLLLGG